MSNPREFYKASEAAVKFYTRKHGPTGVYRVLGFLEANITSVFSDAELERLTESLTKLVEEKAKQEPQGAPKRCTNSRC